MRKAEAKAKERTKLSFAFAFAFALASCQPNPYRQGETLYRYHCESCHMEDGSGLARLIPSLRQSDLFSSDPAKLICLVRNGVDYNPQTGQSMPANTSLNDVEMTNLINFLGSKYGSHAQTVQVQEVKKLMAACQKE